MSQSGSSVSSPPSLASTASGGTSAGGRILRKLPGSHLPPPCEFRILRDDVIWAAERRDHIPIQVNLGLIVPGECNMIFGVRLSRPVSHEETNHGIMRAHDLKRTLVDVRPPALANVRLSASACIAWRSCRLFNSLSMRMFFLIASFITCGKVMVWPVSARPC